MLEQREPKSVWKYFEQFCAIPHPSGYEEKAADFIRECAARLGLPASTDAAGNVLIRKKAADTTPNRATVVLQSHLDMVPQKNTATTHDFKKDPIRPCIDGEWVKAQGTTLGADNGIGVAIALAVLESSSISHGPVEALFTLDEERGMTGAFGLTDDFLAGRKLINLDTENENEICIGCAGGTDVIADVPAPVEPVGSSPAKAFSLAVRGLRGGHSGMEIHLNRANALKCMVRVLTGAAAGIDLRLVTLYGGTARNAIPREASAEVVVTEDQAAAFIAAVKAAEAQIAGELTATDRGFTLTISETALPKETVTRAAMQQLLPALAECPYGVLKMSPDIPGMVQTSNNLSIITRHPGTFRVECMLRSSSDTDLADLRKRITGLFTRQKARISVGSTYPGWQPDPKSSLLAVMKATYRELNNKEPEIVTVHAGLECGIIGSKFPGMEIISCGPTIQFAHSPDERMHIASVERFWRWLVAGLERL